MPWWAQAIVAVGLFCGPLLGWSVCTRLRFAREPRAFRCRLGAAALMDGETIRWSRRRTRARWVNDVLLIQTGVLRTNITPVPAGIAAGTVLRDATSDVGLGDRPVALRLTTADGRRLEIAVDHVSRTLLVGPFLAAAIPGLPRAPRERGA